MASFIMRRGFVIIVVIFNQSLHLLFPTSRWLLRSALPRTQSPFFRFIQLIKVYINQSTSSLLSACSGASQRSLATRINFSKRRLISWRKLLQRLTSYAQRWTNMVTLLTFILRPDWYSFLDEKIQN